MELNTLSFAVFTRLAGVVFGKAKEAVPAVARASGIWKIDPIPANSGTTRDFTEHLDLNLYASAKPEGNQAGRARVVAGYNKVATLRRYAADIGITYEMRQFNKYPEVISRLTALGQQLSQRLELDLQHRLGFGTAATYTDLDGTSNDISTGASQSLFNTAHTLTGSATTYRNRVAGNPLISKGALESLERLAAEQILNNLAEKITVPFDILWTTDDPQDVNTAREFLQSTASPEATHAGVVNVYRAKFKHVALPLVATTAAGLVDTAKRHYWGLASSQMSDLHLAVWEEPHLKNPASLNAGEEFSTDDWNYGARGGWALVNVTGRSILASTGDAAA